MIDICIALDQSVSPHIGVRAIQNTWVFWQAVFQTPRPTPFLGSRLRRQNFNLTIPPAAQATNMAAKITSCLYLVQRFIVTLRCAVNVITPSFQHFLEV